MIRVVNIAIALLLAGIRIAGHKSPSFQAVAHLFVGGCLGVWLAPLGTSWLDWKSMWLWLAIALSVIEVICFFTL